MNNARKKVNLDMLYIPKDSLQKLKTRVQEVHPECVEVTSGDIIQALGAMIVHTVEGKPLVPVKPKCMLALIQIPGLDPSYFGNAVHPMAVGVQPERLAELRGEEDYMGALRMLATEIRACAKEIRSKPVRLSFYGILIE